MGIQLITLAILLLVSISISNIATAHAISTPALRAHVSLSSDAADPMKWHLSHPQSSLSRRNSIPTVNKHHWWDSSWVPEVTWLLLIFDIISALVFIGIWPTLWNILKHPLARIRRG
ncbi:hypothetical protein N7G274_002842 [Stereocaulon virgatum]|uniref:ATP synthase F0 subunit 8 n=1 Tax=Stereocaulon virgatum TaxID=373712 RepID=A0ABR4AH11_9LECA